MKKYVLMTMIALIGVVQPTQANNPINSTEQVTETVTDQVTHSSEQTEELVGNREKKAVFEGLKAFGKQLMKAFTAYDAVSTVAEVTKDKDNDKKDSNSSSGSNGSNSSGSNGNNEKEVVCRQCERYTHRTPNMIQYQHYNPPPKTTNGILTRLPTNDTYQT